MALRGVFTAWRGFAARRRAAALHVRQDMKQQEPVGRPNGSHGFQRVLRDSGYHGMVRRTCANVCNSLCCAGDIMVRRWCFDDMGMLTWMLVLVRSIYVRMLMVMALLLRLLLLMPWRGAAHCDARGSESVVNMYGAWWACGCTFLSVCATRVSANRGQRGRQRSPGDVAHLEPLCDVRGSHQAPGLVN